MNSIKGALVTIIVFFTLFLPAQNNARSSDKNAKAAQSYNKGLEHYNKALEMIKNEKEMDLAELESLQKKSKDELKAALPYFKKAYKLDSKHEGTLEGLYGVYFGLNDIQKTEYFRMRLLELRRE